MPLLVSLIASHVSFPSYHAMARDVPWVAMMRQTQVATMASNGDAPLLPDGNEDSVLLLDSVLPVTRKNLARLNVLNGRKDHDTDSAYLFDDETDDTMKKVCTTHSSFEQRVYQNGILDPVASRPPPGLSTIRDHATQRRTSTQPSEHAHQVYCNKISKSYNEGDVSHLIQSRITRDYDDPQYHRAHGRAITEIPIQHFNDSLSSPFPDVLEGLDTQVLPHYLHDNALHQKNSLSFCHFATEFKRTDGNLHQATVQAAYDGAVLVNARDRALAEAKAGGIVSTAINKAAEGPAVFTCVSDGKVAKVYTHHFEGGQYHQNLVARESLLNYPNRGRELIRNTQDYARSKAYELANLLGADLEEEEEEEEESSLKVKKAVVKPKGWSFWP
jgi:hypothetical protein